MKQSERLEKIIETLQRDGIVKVSEISRLLGCSEVTIRTDIRKLDEQGVLKKTYGAQSPKKKGLPYPSCPANSF